MPERHLLQNTFRLNVKSLVASIDYRSLAYSVGVIVFDI